METVRQTNHPTMTFILKNNYAIQGMHSQLLSKYQEKQILCCRIAISAVLSSGYVPNLIVAEYHEILQREKYLLSINMIDIPFFNDRH